MTRPYEAIRCPVEACEYWCMFGGYLEPVIRQFYKHVKREHSELPEILQRRMGGIIDRAFGDAIQAAYPSSRGLGATHG